MALAAESRSKFVDHVGQMLRRLAPRPLEVLLGHTSIATTQIYVAVPDERRFEAASRLDFS